LTLATVVRKETREMEDNSTRADPLKEGAIIDIMEQLVRGGERSNRHQPGVDAVCRNPSNRVIEREVPIETPRFPMIVSTEAALPLSSSPLRDGLTAFRPLDVG